MNKNIINLLNNIKNSKKTRSLSFKTYNTVQSIAILKTLYNLGYIRGFKITNNFKNLEVYLKYKNGKNAIRDILFFSKQGNNIFLSVNGLKKLKNKLLNGKSHGFFICSTTKGIITDQEMRLLNIGGKILFKIW